MDKEKLKNLLMENAKRVQIPVLPPPPVPPQIQKMPSAIEMAKNLAITAMDTAVSVAHGNPLNVDSDEANRRKQICQKCPAYNAMQDRCTKCGCYMAVKAYLKAASCPLRKW